MILMLLSFFIGYFDNDYLKKQEKTFWIFSFNTSKEKKTTTLINKTKIYLKYNSKISLRLKFEKISSELIKTNVTF